MKSLLRLLPYLKPYRGLVALSIGLAIPLSLLRLGPAPLIRYLLDDLLREQDPSLLWQFPALLIGLYTLNFFVRFAHYYCLRIVIIRVNQRLKNQLFKHLLKLSVDYFTAQSTGQLLARTYTDPQSVDAGLSCINLFIREPLTLFILFGYALFLNWQLTLMTLLLVPPLVWLFSVTGRHLKRYLHRIADLNGSLLARLQESYAGIRVVKVFRLEAYLMKKFFRQSQDYSKLLLKTSLLEEASHPLVEFFTACALAPIAYFGSLQVLEHRMTPGDLFAFFTAFAMMMNPIRLLNEVHLKLNQAAVACDRIFQIFEWQPRVKQLPFPEPFSGFKEALVFDQVSFAYPDRPDHLVLQEVSFTLKRGQLLALVGQSGSGKTSLIQLIPRLFDVTAGYIRMDGRDLRSLALKDLQDQLAVVNQDLFLINDTVLENIRLGYQSASFEEIEQAARRAHALDFIQHLPEGFQTVIGDRGQKLSGGQKQRLSIARAFLRQAPILILDEATSSLDTQSEKAVQAALEDLMKDRTTLVIAHRLSTIQHAHEILVMKSGQLVERGQHEALLRLGGEYAWLQAHNQERSEGA